MSSLAVESVGCSACVNRTCLRCTIWAAALRTASSLRCAASSMGLSVCLVRCWCRACVTAPLMVASLTRGSQKRCSVACCAWLWVGQPSRCRRVSAADQPTSVSLPVWRGHFLKYFQSSGVVWSHRQRVCSSGTWMCLRASHLATLLRNGSCSLRSWMRVFGGGLGRLLGAVLSSRGGFAVSPGAPGCVPGCLCCSARGRDFGWG